MTMGLVTGEQAELQKNVSGSYLHAVTAISPKAQPSVLEK